MKHTITSIGFALLIVTSVFAMPMNNVGVVGTASASHNCDTTDAAVTAVTFTYVNKDKCLNNHVQHAVEEVRDYEKNKTELDLYSAAAGQNARNEEFGVLYDNYLQDTETTAWSKAEVAIARAYENGSTKAEAKVEAKQAIRDYYAPKQENLIESYNTSTNSWWYIRDRSQQEFEYPYSELLVGVHVMDDNGEQLDGSSSLVGYDPSHDGIQTTEVELVNGSTSKANQITIQAADTMTTTVNVGNVTGVDTNMGESYTAYELYMMDPDDGANGGNISMVRFDEFSQRWEAIEDKSQELTNESDAFVDSTWQDYQDGDIDSTDVISRNTLMFEYGTATTSGNGSYYDAIGASASMGLETPNLDGTGQMTISVPTTNSTYQGLVFARNAPNGTWEVGVEYNPNSIEGPVMLATTDGNLTELTRNFVIDEAVDKNNNTQETVETTNYNYQTSDTSDLQAKYDRLLNLTEELENRSQSVGTGGGTTGDSDTSDPKIPDWLTEKHGGIPVYGFILSGLALAYVVSATRKD